MFLDELEGPFRSNPFNPLIVVRADEEREVDELALGDLPPVQLELEIGNRAPLVFEGEVVIDIWATE